MSCPRVFVSSTYYDLKHVRKKIREYILDLGYEPVLSEFSDVFYQPGTTVQNSCLIEIPKCDIFVLIVGKRYGSPFPGEPLSIIHKEYIVAQNTSIPIYAFIDIDVLCDYELYIKNGRNEKCQFRCVTDVEIFRIIDEIKKAAKDNSLIPYSSICEIRQHLKKQWASLFKDFLQKQRHKIPKDIEPIHLDLEELNKKLNVIGIGSLDSTEVSKSSSILEIIFNLGGTFKDNSTDYLINFKGKNINIGKDVLRILDEELKSARNLQA